MTLSLETRRQEEEIEQEDGVVDGGLGQEMRDLEKEVEVENLKQSCASSTIRLKEGTWEKEEYLILKEQEGESRILVLRQDQCLQTGLFPCF